MFRFLADHNFNGNIVDGILRCQAPIDIVRAADVGLSQADDPMVLEWATEQNRIVLTHDRATMPAYARQRLSAGRSLSGLFVVSSRRPTGQVIQEIELIVVCSELEEWRNRIVYLPL